MWSGPTSHVGTPGTRYRGLPFPPDSPPSGKVRSWGDEPVKAVSRKGGEGPPDSDHRGAGPPRIATLKLEAVGEGLRPALSFRVGGALVSDKLQG